MMIDTYDAEADSYGSWLCGIEELRRRQMAKTLKVGDNGRGHNSGGMIDGEALKRYVDRVVNLMEDRKALNEDIKQVYEESKDAGFVTKLLRQLVKEAMMEPEVLEDHLAQMDALRHALGRFGDTPLGEAAVKDAAKPKRSRRDRAQEALDKAEAHLSGDESSANEGLTPGAVPAPYEDIQ